MELLDLEVIESRPGTSGTSAINRPGTSAGPNQGQGQAEERQYILRTVLNDDNSRDASVPPEEEDGGIVLPNFREVASANPRSLLNLVINLVNKGIDLKEPVVDVDPAKAQQLVEFLLYIHKRETYVSAAAWAIVNYFNAINESDPDTETCYHVLMGRTGRNTKIYVRAIIKRLMESLRLFEAMVKDINPRDKILAVYVKTVTLIITYDYLAPFIIMNYVNMRRDAAEFEKCLETETASLTWPGNEYLMRQVTLTPAKTPGNWRTSFLMTWMKDTNRILNTAPVATAAIALPLPHFLVTPSIDVNLPLVDFMAARKKIIDHKKERLEILRNKKREYEAMAALVDREINLEVAKLDNIEIEEKRIKTDLIASLL